MEIYKNFERIKKEKKNQQEITPFINVKSTGSAKKYIAFAAKLLINEKFSTIYLKATGKAVNIALITADVLKKKIKGLGQINEILSEEIEDDFQAKDSSEKIKIKKNLGILQITLSKEENLDKAHYGYQPAIPLEKVKEFGTSFLPKEGFYQFIV